MHFIRWDEGDANEVAPSFHSAVVSRRRRRRTEDVATDTASTVPTLSVVPAVDAASVG